MERPPKGNAITESVLSERKTRVRQFMDRIAAKLDLKFVEVPIRYRARAYGQTNISRFKHGWLLLKMALFALGRIKFV